MAGIVSFFRTAYRKSDKVNERVIAIDAGNSRIKIGLLDRTAPTGNRPACHRDLVVPLGEPVPFDQLTNWVKQSEVPVVQVLLSGSNPPVIEEISALCEQHHLPEPCQVSRQLPLQIHVDFPDKVGMDRLLNAIGINAARPAERPAIVVSCGTACTVDLIDGAGVFCGGSILPGFEMSAKALHHYTALLPRIPVEELSEAPSNGLGKNTRAALQSGLFWGQVGAVRELIQQLSESLGAHQATPDVYLTGGGANLLSTQFPDAILEPHLTLYGIVLSALHQRSGHP
ncbi:Type III pantothenate kinase [Polystyrenella longa]|uniref:Type III pantothenate kinase n=1 Tax=Polystyrenella longa TaxID=2528007 RepID=A0A518CGF7_9PLAN|nr:type III pantothenate kinase [Polystyrenella longa]QDU78316.1 Type III pantothenate kinase [Polystyrenella longa]